MTALEERVARELRAERDLVPPGSRPPLPRKPQSPWLMRLGVAAGIVVLVTTGLMLTRFISGPEPTATVTIMEVSGEREPEVVAAWRTWWEAWVQVRETATSSADGGVRFNPQPLSELAVDRTFTADEMFTMDTDGSPLGVGVETVIRLTPEIRIEGDRAFIRDCLYMDPISWPVLRDPDSTGGTVVYEAEMVHRETGWLMVRSEPETLIEQITADDLCVPGEQ
ncbi:MAG: hypothetical protein GEU79_02695 [Acidimicrobiia bacterium]|nr:hypothetical protein [Acidimicrobiia bacterium]